MDAPEGAMVAVPPGTAEHAPISMTRAAMDASRDRKSTILRRRRRFRLAAMISGPGNDR
jgi:hypothetical protein